MKQELYAKLLIQVGLNVKENQLVVIKAPVEVYDFVRLLVKEAYKRKAKDVIVRYMDEQVTHQHYLYADDQRFESVPEYESSFYNQTSEQGACYLTLLGQDPDLMKDIQPIRMMTYSKAFKQATKAYRNRLDFMECQWCLAAVATKDWATKVYPDESEVEAVQHLWTSIYEICYVDSENPIDIWNQRKEDFQQKVDLLNSLQIQSLHYTNKYGTDLTIELPEDYEFAGGGSLLKDGTYYFPNLPTEEVFGAPLKTGVNGKVVSTYPLNYNGSLIEDFWFEFKDGKVVDYGAEKGKEVLTSILFNDENSAYLGEVALVPYDSPISQKRTIFYETLIDENASCHLALGQSYAECLKGGLDMSEEELKSKGMNQSFIHVDFMVGSEDLEIVATTKNNEKIKIFEHGKYEENLLNRKR